MELCGILWRGLRNSSTSQGNFVNWEEKEEDKKVSISGEDFNSFSSRLNYYSEILRVAILIRQKI